MYNILRHTTDQVALDQGTVGEGWHCVWSRQATVNNFCVKSYVIRLDDLLMILAEICDETISLISSNLKHSTRLESRPRRKGTSTRRRRCALEDASIPRGSSSGGSSPKRPAYKQLQNNSSTAKGVDAFVYRMCVCIKGACSLFFISRFFIIILWLFLLIKIEEVGKEVSAPNLGPGNGPGRRGILSRPTRGEVTRYTVNFEGTTPLPTAFVKTRVQQRRSAHGTNM